MGVLFSFRKKKQKVDLGGLRDEKEALSDFLRTALKVDVAFDGNGVSVDSGELSLQELQKLATKFIYHRHLNNRYWAAVERGAVRIKEFKEADKSEKRKKKGTPPSTITHGW